MIDAPTGPRVLLVEDSPDDRHLLDMACRRQGLEVDWQVVETCAGLERTLAAIDPADGPLLVIMDLRLPDGLSTDLLPSVRRALPTVPVAVFSTSASAGDRERIQADPAQRSRYLVKPHSFSGYAEILDLIRSTVSAAGGVAGDRE